MMLGLEIASYAFCPEAWRLGSVLGLQSKNERELTRGEKPHEILRQSNDDRGTCYLDWTCVRCLRCSLYRRFPMGGRPMGKMARYFFGLVSLIFGGLVVLWATRARKIRGLGAGETVALDDLLLVSERLKILGRPDRIVRQGGFSSRNSQADSSSDLSWAPLAGRRLLPAG